MSRLLPWLFRPGLPLCGSHAPDSAGYGNNLLDVDIDREFTRPPERSTYARHCTRRMDGGIDPVRLIGVVVLVVCRVLVDARF